MGSDLVHPLMLALLGPITMLQFTHTARSIASGMVQVATRAPLDCAVSCYPLPRKT